MRSIYYQRAILTAHPSTPCDAVQSLAVAVRMTQTGTQVLEFDLEADLSRLSIPAIRAPQRAEELWKHTCFEAFVSAADQGYRELNFSPSTEWAVYSFTGYRTGMAAAELQSPPTVSVRQEPGRLYMLTAARLPAHSAGVPPAKSGPLRVALAAVIEQSDGGLSYWALRHPPGKPDFHHPEAFALTVSFDSGTP